VATIFIQGMSASYQHNWLNWRSVYCSTPSIMTFSSNQVGAW